MSKDNDFKPKGEEDVKAEVIEQLGLDEETQSELIEQITNERLEHQKTLSTAIRQKRDKADALKSMEAGKDFYKKKAGLELPKGDEVNKPKEQTGLSREEAILFAQGFTEADVKLASKISKINETTLTEATQDDYFKGQIQAQKDKETADKAGLPASQAGSQAGGKDTGEMTKEEHQAYVAEELKKAGLN